MTSLKQQDTTWMNGVSPIPTPAAAACWVARIGAQLADIQLPSTACKCRETRLSLGWIPGVLSWNKLTPKPHRTFYFSLLFIGLVSGDNHLTLQKTCFVGMRASMLPAGKNAVTVIQCWKFLIIKTVKCSKVNITKGDLRFISNHRNWVGQVSTLMFGYQGRPLL